MKYVNVTNMIDFGPVDDECLPITRCICGSEFPMWEHTISIYHETPTECPNCHRKLYFRYGVHVYEVIDE